MDRLVIAIPSADTEVTRNNPLELSWQ